MGYRYPVDVEALVALARQRGDGLADWLGLTDDLRDDLKLTTIAWGAGDGWFPLHADHSFHGALDLGLPDLADCSWLGADVLAITEGEVIYCDSGLLSESGYDFGRVIVRHPSPSGGDVYALYQQLGDVVVTEGEFVEEGQVLGRVGWYGGFSHLHFAVASPAPLGDGTDLTPLYDRGSLPSGDGVWNVLQVRVGTLDPLEWTVLSDMEGDWHLVNGIEFVRWARGESYQHDTGRGSNHGIDEAVCHERYEAPAEQENLHAASILQCTPLKSCDAALALAEDPQFDPFGRPQRASLDRELVKALQRALKLCKYDLGRFGPNHDGVDGDFGRTTEDIVKHFQEGKLRDIDFSELGKSADDLRTDGLVDWLTLLGIDVYAAAHEREAAEEAEAIKPEPGEKAAKDNPLPSGAWVFDGKSKKLSPKFAMRMYKALLYWEWDGEDGVAYSTNATDFPPYVENKPENVKNEWPDMADLGLEATSQIASGEKSYSAYKALGVTWTWTGFTNCTNSQMAAFVVAAGGKSFGVKDDAGTTTTYDIQKDEVTRDVRTSAAGANLKKGALMVFEQTAVTGTPFFTTDGKALQNTTNGNLSNAMVFLGIGEVVCGMTDKQEDYKKLRIGDWVNSATHAYLVGDVRYGVWFTDGENHTNPDYVLDQATFLDSAAGTLYKCGKTTKARKVEGRTLMTEEDCDWISSNADAFEERIVAFLAKTQLEVDGVQRTIKKVEVVCWQVWTANCVWSATKKTAYGKVYEFKDEAWVHSETETKANLTNLGISRPWRDASRIGFGRFYGPE